MDETMKGYDTSTMSGSINMMKDAFSGMPSLKSALSSAGKGFTNAMRGFSDVVANGVTKIRNVHEDDIVIPDGSTSMIGEDLSALKSSSSYGTDMMSANLKSTIGKRMFDTLLPEQKASYEVVLVSKKYSLDYESNPVQADSIGQAYADKMVQYRAACEKAGISWQSVMQVASWELQTQTMEYAEDSKGLFGAKSSEGNRVVSARAHSMMLQCAPDGWEDTFLPNLGGKITYEDTLDTQKKDVSFLQNIGRWFSEKWQAIKNFVTSPFRAVRDNADTLVRMADNTIAYDKACAAATKQNYVEKKAEVEAKVDEIKEDLKPVGEAISNKAKEQYDKAKDAFGNFVEENRNKEDQLER